MSEVSFFVGNCNEKGIKETRDCQLLYGGESANNLSIKAVANSFYFGFCGNILQCDPVMSIIKNSPQIRAMHVHEQFATSSTRTTLDMAPASRCQPVHPHHTDHNMSGVQGGLGKVVMGKTQPESVF